MAKTMKKLDSKLQKQQQGWPKILTTARKYNKDENLENYDSEVQTYVQAHFICIHVIALMISLKFEWHDQSCMKLEAVTKN